MVFVQLERVGAIFHNSLSEFDKEQKFSRVIQIFQETFSRTLIYCSIEWKDEVDVRRVEIMLNMCFQCLDSSPKHHPRVGNFAGQTQGSTVLRTDL